MKSTTVIAILIGIATCGGCFRASDAPQPLPAVEYDIGPELALTVGESELRITPAGVSSTDAIAWPADVPLFDHGAFTLAERSPTGEFASHHVSASVDEVRRFYAEQLAAKGWKIDDENSTGTASTYVATKAGDELTVLLDEDESGTAITLSHRRQAASGER